MSRKKKSKTEEVQQDLVPNLDNTTDIRLAAEAAIANRVIQPAGIIVKLDVCKDTGRLIAIPMLSDGVGGLADLDPNLDVRGMTWDQIVYEYTECAKRAIDDKKEDEEKPDECEHDFSIKGCNSSGTQEAWLCSKCNEKQWLPNFPKPAI